MNRENIERLVDTELARKAHYKEGPNVIHLEYYRHFISDYEIAEIGDTLKEAGLELSYVDNTGAVFASVDDFQLHIAFFLSDPIVQSVLLGLGTNALWDVIKKVVLSVWKKVRTKYWSNRMDEKHKINLGISAKLGKGRYISLKIDGDLSEESALQAVEQIVGLFRSQSQDLTPQKEMHMEFDAVNGLWVNADEINKSRQQSRE